MNSQSFTKGSKIFVASDINFTMGLIISGRVKVIMFTDEQAFEFYADSSSDIPVASDFLSNIIKKVVSETIDNPFYVAYTTDIASGVNPKDPIILNYELLCIPKYGGNIKFPAPKNIANRAKPVIIMSLFFVVMLFLL